MDSDLKVQGQQNRTLCINANFMLTKSYLLRQ